MYFHLFKQCRLLLPNQMGFLSDKLQVKNIKLQVSDKISEDSAQVLPSASWLYLKSFTFMIIAAHYWIVNDTHPKALLAQLQYSR